MDGQNRLPGSEGTAETPQPYAPAYPDYAPYPPARAPRRRRALVRSLIAVLLVGLLTVAGVLAFDGGGGLRGNAGVVAAYEYYCAYTKQSQASMGSIQKRVLSRLGKEPFEIESSFKLASDAFRQSGIPLSSIPFGIDAKYDLTDLGVKFNVMGMDIAGAYVIGDEFVLNVGNEAGSERISLPVTADLKEPMALPDRFFAFLPFLSGDKSGLGLRVLEAFAQSVPDEYTDTFTMDIYSPVARKKLDTFVIETQLDSKAIAEVIGNFAGRLQKDEALSGELQDYLNEFTGYFSLGDADLDAFIGRLENIKESDLEGVQISWEVYRRQGRYTGLSFTFEQADQGKMTLLSEFGRDAFYTGYDVDMPGGIVMESSTLARYSGNRIEIETETVLNSDYMNETVRQAESVEFSQNGANAYAGEMDATIETVTEYAEDYFGMPDTEDRTETVQVTLTGDIDFRFGSGLGTLRESSRWDDVYEMEWGTLEDALEGFNALSDAFSGIMGIA
jgi:hypothetical protein